jgi:hypothetical protein
MTDTAMHAQRGQTLLETVFFIPFMLLAMFGIMYFSQYGVLQERSLQGARFASLVDNAGATSPFSLVQMYHELHREGNNQVNPGFPSSVTSCTANAATDGQNALIQAETLPSGGTGATAPPYFQPDGTSASETGCDASSISLSSTEPNEANWYYVAHFTHVEADKAAPLWIRDSLPGVSSGHIRGGMVNISAAAPDNIIYCSPGFALALANSLGSIEPVTLAGPFAGYQTPPPSAKHSC